MSRSLLVKAAVVCMMGLFAMNAEAEAVNSAVLDANAGCAICTSGECLEAAAGCMARCGTFMTQCIQEGSCLGSNGTWYATEGVCASEM